VQLTEYGNWNDPSTYRTMIQTRDRVGTKAVKFTAGAHNLENLQMYIVRARAFDPEDGRRGEWTSWKQIYYFGFDRYIYARYGDVRPVNLPELPAAFGSSPLPNGNEMDEYTADAVEAVPDPETVARIEQAMADDAAVNAPPQIAPAPSDSLINPPEEETAEEPPPDDVVWAQPIDVDPGYEYPPEEEGAWEDDDDPYEEPSEEEDEWWGDDPTDGDDQDDWS